MVRALDQGFGVQSLRLTFSAECWQNLAAKQPDGDNADFVKDDEGNGHHQLIDHIRGWREDRGNDKGKQKGVFAVFTQEGGIDQSDLGE